MDAVDADLFPASMSAVHLHRKAVRRSDRSIRCGNCRSQSHPDRPGYQRSDISNHRFQGRVRIDWLAARNIHDFNRSAKSRVGRKKRYRARCQPGSEPQLHAIPKFSKQQHHRNRASASAGYRKRHLGNGCDQRIRPRYSITRPQLFRARISCRWRYGISRLRNSRFLSVRNKLRFQWAA